MKALIVVFAFAFALSAATADQDCYVVAEDPIPCCDLHAPAFIVCETVEGAKFFCDSVFGSINEPTWLLETAESGWNLSTFLGYPPTRTRCEVFEQAVWVSAPGSPCCDVIIHPLSKIFECDSRPSNPPISQDCGQ